MVNNCGHLYLLQTQTHLTFDTKLEPFKKVQI